LARVPKSFASIPWGRHQLPLVFHTGDIIAVMEGGRLVETGEAEALCASPREAYTRQLIAATLELPAGAA